MVNPSKSIRLAQMTLIAFWLLVGSARGQLCDHPAAGGNSDSLVILGDLTLGLDLEANVSAPIGSVVTFFAGTVPTSLDLGPGLLVGIAPSSIFASVITAADAGGLASVQTTLPMGILAGERFFVQAGVLTPSGALYLTNVSSVEMLASGVLQAPSTFSLAKATSGVQLVDLDGDEILDMVTANPFPQNDVSVYRGLGGGEFLPPVHFAVGGSPLSFALGDFNNDDLHDLVVATPSDLAVLIGDGLGGFGAASIFATSGVVDSIAVADINSDGYSDAVVSAFTSGGVQVFLGDPVAVLASPDFIAIGLLPMTVSLSDFNGDSHLDLVVTSRLQGVATLTGIGDGTFTPPVFVPDSPGTFGEHAMGLIDEDSIPDIAVIRPALNQIAFYYGTPTGTFSVGASYEFTEAVSKLRITELDRDGLPDLVLAHQSSATIQVIRGTGSGNFVEGRVIETSAIPNVITVGDFDSDTLFDIVTAPVNSAFVEVINNRFRTLQPPDVDVDEPFAVPAPPSLPAGEGPVDLAQGDFNGDGLNDVVALNRFSDDVAVYLSICEGSTVGLTAPVFYPTNQNEPHRVVTGHFNQDGFLDIACLSAVDDSFAVFLNLGNGSFGAPVSYQSPALGADYYDCVAGDFDGDGLTELAVLRGLFGAQIEFHVPTGTGGFSPPFVQPVFTQTGTSGFLTTGDLNNDGVPDLAMVLRNVGLPTGFWLPGQGNGQFSPTQLFDIGGLTGFFTIGDVDEDGLQDILAGQGSSPLMVAHGTGSGQFAPPVVFDGPGGIRTDALVLDMDRDGVIDVVALCGLVGSLVHYKGLGGGVFAAPVEWAAGLFPICSVMVDIDDDGNEDLLVGNRDSNDLSVFRSGLQEGLAPHSLYLPFGAYDVEIGDLNNDGANDLIYVYRSSSNPTQYSIGVSWNLGDSRFSPTQILDTGPRVDRPHLADLNNDGFLDIVLAAWAGQAVTLILSTGGGNFDSPVSYPVTQVPRLARTTDLNNDGLLDVIVLKNTGFSVLLGIGAGVLGTPGNYAVPATVTFALDFEVADLDLDGFSEVILPSGIVGGHYVFPGSGGVSFQPPIQVNLGFHTGHVEVGDLNGDGFPDLMTTILSPGPFDRDTAISLSVGGSSFAIPQLLTSATTDTALRVADLNGDNINDLVRSSDFSTPFGDLTGFSVRIGAGGATFLPESVVRFPSSSGVPDLAIGDLDGDGRPDIVMAGYPARIQIFRNQM